MSAFDLYLKYNFFKEGDNLLAHKLKEIRKKYKFTQQSVAEALSIDRTTYTCYETGRHEPSYQIIIKLSKIYRVSPSYFYTEETYDSLQLADSVNEEDIFFTEFNRKDEHLLLMNFRLLDDESKKKVFEFIKSLDNEGI